MTCALLLIIFRLPAAEFKPSRDQRQALNRWNRFVLGENYLKEVEKKYPKSKTQKKQDNNTFDLLSNIHSSESANLKSDIEPDHKLVVTLEPDTYTEEKFALFSNYQRHVHHETDSDISKQGFKRFLCNSPLHRQITSSSLKLGSYHQCYRLDGRLIAMGVLDLLPHAVSGVYFLYHSDYEKWSFGKLSALREAALALEDGYQYYYMGYYIHSCRKMRYKGDYKPQYVLDFNSHEWEPLGDEVKGLMEERRYPRPPASKHADVAAAKGEGPGDVQAIKHPSPVAAMQSDLSVVELGMPGVEPLDQILEQVDINSMRLTMGAGRTHQMRDLMSWASERRATERGTLKAAIAEFAAAIGPEVARAVIVDLSQ
ncbi:arginyl-tRNA--protein transferase 1-like [Teratosphaeria destructans]|uniref:Arginyl-tRNA--protein transferase 1 n=1 Tax=Teratosphaeria destructans TaxID=418781 RepID=A0A9W7SR34_9PEZI|nr:arginyl-tRNA--protein transferase 1-like [Teratosphaeria destructans]